MAPIEQIEAVLIVVVHHIKAVLLHGVGAGAIVKHGFDVVIRQHMLAHLADKFMFVEIMLYFAFGQIFEFIAVGEVVYRHNIGDAACIERFHNIAADKAGRAGYDNGHHFSFSAEAV